LKLNNYIKNKVAFYLLSKRCPNCYSEYNKESIMISQQFGYTNKQQFLIGHKPTSDIPVKENGRRITETGQMSDLYSIRYTLSPAKSRMHAVVIAITMCCKKCGLCKDVSVDLGKL